MSDDRPRSAPANMSGSEFRKLGHALVDAIAEFYDSLPTRALTRDQSPSEVRALIGDDSLPEHGEDPAALLQTFAPIFFDHSLHNGHPRFLGYITSSAAPLGALGDLLAAAVNPNLGAWGLSPVATEIERQTIRWLAELIGYPSDGGGLMVSGGNMANLVGFWAARRAKAPWAIREAGLYGDARALAVYVSKATHTWIETATDLAGLGTGNIRWIDVDAEQRMRIDALEAQIREDRSTGRLPFLIVGTAGSVGTGAIDPLPALAAIAKREELWFHVDGAYGAPAAALPEASDDLRGLSLADSVALDPHKWLYSPLEAACALVRDTKHLTDAFSFRPDYYRFDECESDPKINYYEYGVQNSRGFRALKVWLTLRAIGREGYVALIRDDIALARQLFEAADAHAELEAVTCNLSITTFRFRPADLDADDPATEAYLNELNEAVLLRIQAGGEAYVSNAIIDGRSLSRACIVNFRTTAHDLDKVIDIFVRAGRKVDAELRPVALR